MRKAVTAAFLALAATLAYAQIFYVENVVAGAAGAAVPTLSNFAAARAVTINTADATNTVYVRFDRDYLLDGEFEDSVQDIQAADDPRSAGEDPVLGAGHTDAWDEDGELLTWGYTEVAADADIEVETTNVLYGYSSLRFDAEDMVQLVANEDFEAATGDDFTSWTENVNAGSGTIESDEVGPYEGTIDALLTGGSAHVDLTSATITVTASTEYVLSIWGHNAAADDVCVARVQEATGGTDYLQADGSWAAGEVDLGEATFDDSTTVYQQYVNTFTTDTGITGITVSLHADVTGDICSFDAVSLHIQPTTEITAISKVKLYDTVANSYVLSLATDAGATGSARLEIQISDPGTAAPLVPQYYTGSAWSATETWISVPYTATLARTHVAFEARTATGHFVVVRIRPEVLGEDEDIYLDAVMLTGAALSTNAFLLSSTPLRVEIAPGGGRFSVSDDGSGTIVSFAAEQ